MIQSQRQIQIQPSSPAPVPAPASSGCIVEMQTIEGDVVRLEAQPTDTLATVRVKAVRQLQNLSDDPNKFVVVTGEGRVVDPGVTIDRLVATGQALSFQLLPQVAYGGC